MSADQDVLYRVEDRVGIVTLNRPDRLNAYTPSLASALKKTFAISANDADVRVIVLTGAGRGFCAGADMSVLSEHVSSGGNAARPPKNNADMDTEFDANLGPALHSDFADAERFSYFVKTKKPVIAAINGPAAGMGLIMALYADIRFASSAAIMTTSFAQRGLIAEHGISWLLPRIVGQANALDLLLSARKITADEAQKMGLANKAFEAATFMENVLAYARTMANTVSPRSMAIMKAQVWKANFQNFNDALSIADAEMRDSLKHSEFREGVSHFLEKRPPRFANL